MITSLSFYSYILLTLIIMKSVITNTSGAAIIKNNIAFVKNSLKNEAVYLK